MSERVTIADVAAEAGVSLMTVSRVINNKGDVSAATRERVAQVVERLGYRPSSIARGLVTQRTGTIGLVVPDVANTFFADVARGAEHRAYAEGYHVFLCNTDEDPGRELSVLTSLEEKRVDGLLLCSSRLAESTLRDVVARYRSTVLVNRQISNADVCTVAVDDQKGGYLAVEHLIRTGHTKLGLLAGPEISHSGRCRLAGFRIALREADIEYDSARTRHCAPTVDGGFEAARDLLVSAPELTALCCYNDLTAIGALRACVQMGRSVPDDVALVGHDDIPLAELVSPPLTTVRVPRYELGSEAVRLLLNCIESRSVNCERVVFSPELVVRASAPIEHW